MLKISESARKELTAFFSDKPKSAIRVYLAPGEQGPNLELVLDNPTEDDAVLEDSGFSFCMTKSLLQQIGGLTVDLSYMGFTLEPDNPLPKKVSGGCSGCCSSCGGSCGF